MTNNPEGLTDVLRQVKPEEERVHFGESRFECTPGQLIYYDTPEKLQEIARNTAGNMNE